MLSIHEKLIAKSENGDYPEVELFEHLKAVAECAQILAPAFGLDKETARKAALLHDAGKANPVFQIRIQGTPQEKRRIGDGVFRHEIASLGFLPLFDKRDWDNLIEAVVAHHKSVDDEKGIYCLNQKEEYWAEDHLEAWEQWAPRALNELQKAGLKTRIVSENEAIEALEYTAEYVEKLQGTNVLWGWSRWRGLLMAADHMASAFPDGIDDFKAGLFALPKTDHFKRRGALYPLSQKSSDDPSPHTMVVAPTGAGKTDYLIRRCQKRIFYCLPFQASINAMTERVREQGKMSTHTVRMQHAASRITDKSAKKEEINLQPFAGASVKVMTPHQLASALFCLPSFEAVLLDMEGQDVIFDEVHTYSKISQAMVLRLVELCAAMGCRVHIGTATLSSKLYQLLVTALGGSKNVYECALTAEEIETYNRHIIYKETDEEDALKKMVDAYKANEKILIVANTVRKAQSLYERLQDDFGIPQEKTLLLHSRFRRMDRAALESRLMEMNKECFGPCIAVSTQVVEVSLDINFDRMLTEAAPIDALIQRFGRINRARLAPENRVLKPVHVLEPAEKTLPYTKEIVQSSFEALPDSGQILREADAQKMIDKVYPEVEPMKIDSAIQWKGADLRKPKLTHNPKAVLLELLEIDAGVCIRYADQDAYEGGTYETRAPIEIPIHQKSLWAFGPLERSEKGNKPFLVNDHLYDEFVGLTPPKKDDNFM